MDNNYTIEILEQLVKNAAEVRFCGSQPNPTSNHVNFSFVVSIDVDKSMPENIKELLVPNTLINKSSRGTITSFDEVMKKGRVQDK